ncbi:hypothetical protein ACFQ0O_31200 [Saccharopolyspora spinosporotrichia]
MPSFDELDLDPRVLQVLSEIGYETPRRSRRRRSRRCSKAMT